MGWRLGHFKPVLCAHPGGATVLLPELSMAISVDTADNTGTGTGTEGQTDTGNVKPTATMLQIPDFKAVLGGGTHSSGSGNTGSGGGGGGVFGSLFGGGEEDSAASAGKSMSMSMSEIEGYFSLYWWCLV